MREKHARKGSNVVTLSTKSPVHPAEAAGRGAAKSPAIEREAHRNGPPVKAGTKPAGMPDVQASADPRNVAIDKVGVKDVTFPIRLRVPQDHPNSVVGPEQTTVANISMYVALPHYQKGTHMSRFLEVLNEHAGVGKSIVPSDIPTITHAIGGNHDGRNPDPRAIEVLLQLKAAHFRHLQVNDQAFRQLVGHSVGQGCQKGSGRFIGPDFHRA